MKEMMGDHKISEKFREHRILRRVFMKLQLCSILVVLAVTGSAKTKAEEIYMSRGDQFLQTVNNSQERAILLENCRIIRGQAFAASHGQNSHLPELWITRYLQSVGTPTALQLLNELRACRFNF